MDNRWFCPICNSSFRTRREQQKHNKVVGHKPVDFIDYSAQKLVRSCKWCKRKRETTSSGNSLHEKYCYSNPNRVVVKGKKLTNEQKKHLSDVMKKRHAEHKAARWKNPHIYESYPESYFSKVIENHFLDKEYKREYPFKGYFFDFAWEKKKKDIEIDGEQHYRYKHQMESDAKKDALAKEFGWTCLRIRWIDMYRNPQKWIQIAVNFINP